MAVLLHGECRVLMAESVGDDLDGYDRLDGSRCMGVSKIVKAESGQGRFLPPDVRTLQLYVSGHTFDSAPDSAATCASDDARASCLVHLPRPYDEHGIVIDSRSVHTLRSVDRLTVPPVD